MTAIGAPAVVVTAVRNDLKLWTIINIGSTIILWWSLFDIYMSIVIQKQPTWDIKRYWRVFWSTASITGQATVLENKKYYSLEAWCLPYIYIANISCVCLKSWKQQLEFLGKLLYLDSSPFLVLWALPFTWNRFKFQVHIIQYTV